MNLGELKSYVSERIHDPKLSTNVVGWINEVLLELASASQWKHYDADKTIATTAPYSTGTASATNGDTVVSFAGGASISAGAAGQLIILSGKTYKIASRDSATQITLDSAYCGATSASLSYQIVFYALDVPADFSVPRMSFASIEMTTGDAYELDYKTTRDLLEWNANESVTNGRPTCVRLFVRKLLLWPPPDAVYHVKIVYRRKFTKVDAEDGDDTEIDWPEDLQYVLLQGVLAVGFEFINDSDAATARGRFNDAIGDAKGRDQRQPGAHRGRLKKWGGGGGYSRKYRLPEPIG